MQDSSLTHRLIAGSVAGAAATVVMQPLRSLTAARVPQAKAPIRQDPGEFMVERVEERLPAKAADRIPEAAEHAAAKSLALGYGITFGALYAMLRPRPGNILAEAAALGLVTWAAGYLGWLPAAELMPPVTKQRPAQIAGPLVEHLVYGLAVVGGLAAARRIESRLS
ncbi:MAG TPA: hypothetical protein VJU87_03515 [Gemmatimonadaceae bacterium]|nr:hypothetical protein [Gemmatimonadaceae bacterium]